MAEQTNNLEPRTGIKASVMPDVSGRMNAKSDLTKFSVKYFKADFNEPADMLTLEDIETRALHSKPGNEEIVLIDKDKFTFLERYFIILKYLEKI